MVDEIQRLVTSSLQPKATLVPRVSKASAAFHQAVHSLVYDMLMQKVKPPCLTTLSIMSCES